MVRGAVCPWCKADVLDTNKACPDCGKIARIPELDLDGGIREVAMGGSTDPHDGARSPAVVDDDVFGVGTAALELDVGDGAPTRASAARAADVPGPSRPLIPGGLAAHRARRGSW